MKTITVSEFRKNFKKYIDITGEDDQLIVNTKRGKSFLIISIEGFDNNEFNFNSLKRILKLAKSIKNRGYYRMKDKRDLFD